MTTALKLPPAVPKPCNDCPWRKNATPAWLGPFSAQAWLEIAHSDTPIACHETIPTGQPSLGEANVQDPQDVWGGSSIRQCKGAALFRVNVCKSPRNRSDAEHDTPHDDPLLATVFANNAAFLAYHGSVPMAYKGEQIREPVDGMEPCECFDCDCDQYGFRDRDGLCDQCADGIHMDDEERDG
jgi:hypothetical protein